MSFASGHKGVLLEGEELAKQMKDWKGYPQGLVRFTPGRWLFPAAYKKYADNYYNFKVEKFFSLFLTHGSAGVNAFAFDWHSKNCPLIPLVALVGRVLHHLLAYEAQGTLVVPL